MGWIGDYADPYTFPRTVDYRMRQTTHSNWSSAEYDELMKTGQWRKADKAKTVGNHAPRRGIGRWEQQPLIPLYVYTRNPDGKSRTFAGIWGNFQDRPRLEVHLDRRAVLRRRFPRRPAEDPPPPDPTSKGGLSQSRRPSPQPKSTVFRRHNFVIRLRDIRCQSHPTPHLGVTRTRPILP